MTRARRNLSKAIAADLTFLRGMEQLHGRETLGALAVQMARMLEDAIAAGDSAAAARYSRELRGALAALGRPEAANDDPEWIRKLSAPVGDTSEP